MTQLCRQFENKKFTLDLDISGSYNISFSIPPDQPDINKYKIRNIKSLFVLQILEPLYTQFIHLVILTAGMKNFMRVLMY